jgi:hypothetical protein
VSCVGEANLQRIPTAIFIPSAEIVTVAQRRKIARMNETQIITVCTLTLLINMAFLKIRTVYVWRLFYVQILAFYKNFL